MGNEAWKQDLAEFKAVTEKFYNKEVSAKDYKGFSGGFGSYAREALRPVCSGSACPEDV